MKRNLQKSFKFLLSGMLFLLLEQVSTAQVTQYATIPYSTGFESGILDNNWYKTSSVAGGRIRIWQSDTLIWGGDTAIAHSGSKFFGMDAQTGGIFNRNESWMGINTSGQTNLHLRFWWTDWNEETDTLDGVFISDDAGVTFSRVFAIAGASFPDNSWNYVDLNLDSINIVRGLSYNATYVIKFQQYDNYYFAGGNDGLMFDDISVSSIPTGVEEYSKTYFSVYPNPSNGLITIQSELGNEPFTLEIKNTLGQLISTAYYQNTNRVNIELKEAPGVYFVELIANNKRQKVSLVKK